MKKMLISLLCMSLLASCSNNNELSIITPTGAPSLAFYNYYNNENYETNSKVNNILTSYMATEMVDIAVIDTISGIKAINNGANYKIAATITFGNYYLASTGNDENKTLDVDDNIVIFNVKDSTPDLIFKSVYGDEFTNLIYASGGVSEAGKCLATGKSLDLSMNVDYVFIAEPALSSVLANKNASTYGKAYVYSNTQVEYKNKHENNAIFQASIFVRNDDNKEYNKRVDELLSSLKEDIESIIADPKVFNSSVSNADNDVFSLKYGMSKEIALSTLYSNNSLGLGYKKAYENKDEIDSYLSIFNMEKTDEEIYYK